jgi:hypothetical protein
MRNQLNNIRTCLPRRNECSIKVDGVECTVFKQEKERAVVEESDPALLFSSAYGRKSEFIFESWKLRLLLL